MKRVPSDADIDAAARQLGVADDSGVCPRSKRAQVAKALVLADDEVAATAGERSLTTAVDSVIATYKQIRAADIGPRDAATITAALAPAILRTAPERNRTHAPK